LTTLDQRCLGLEQEFFLVGEDSVLSNSADELLAGCWETARSAGKDPACFAPEVSSGMIEVIVSPVRSLAELSGEYVECLKLALEAGRGTGLRLYPLATYPLPISPALRDEPRYRMQAQTLGAGRREILASWGLLPYATDVEELVEQRFASYHAWLSAMDRAGVERRLFFDFLIGSLRIRTPALTP
jgi:glutamate-cysteine ligase